MARLVIVQPYVPAYRVAFFTSLVDSMRSLDIECVVAAPAAKGKQGLRRDATSGAPWQVSLRGHTWERRDVTLAYYGSSRARRGASAAIVPASGTCLDTYLALGSGLRGTVKVGLWGHIGAFVKPASLIDVWLETRQMRLADHVFAYTASGAETARERGVDPSRITVVQNSIDTTSLQRHVASVTDEQADAFRAEHGFGRARVLAFIGGMDDSKRIRFLSEALDVLWAEDASIRCLAAGSGEHAHMLDEAVARGQVRRIGYADDRTKALVGRVAECLVNPGRIGLVAVDALVLGLPVVTTHFGQHGPEVEYLTEGVTRFTTPDDPQAFAHWLAAHDLARSPAHPGSAWFPSLDEMVDRFTSGVVQMMGS